MGFEDSIALLLLWVHSHEVSRVVPELSPLPTCLIQSEGGIPMRGYCPRLFHFVLPVALSFIV